MRVTPVTVPALLVVSVVVVVAGDPVMTMLVNALSAGGGVVVEPAMVDPLDWPEELPPASADWPHKPAATSNRGRAATRIERESCFLCDFMMVLP